MFNYNHLYYFYITAKLNGVTAAARHLNTSQSSLSTQLKTLEESLDRDLFQKSGRNMELTSDGRAIYGFCRRVFEITEELSDFLVNTGESRGPRLVVGVSNQVEFSLVTEAISRMVSDKKGLELPMISMISTAPEELLTKLNVNEIDAFFTGNPIYSDEYEVITEYKFPVVLLSKHRLHDHEGIKTKKEALEYIKTRDAGLVLPSIGVQLRHEIDSHISQYKIKKKIVFESNVLASISKAISQGLGIGFLPLPYVYRDVKKEILSIIGPEEGFWTHKLFLVTPTRLKSHPLILELKEHFDLLTRGISKT